ncbi:hypothetical protein V495_07188 [Pseudogymnoascus sp. VKM F-4514 (FW-929)]|nr:hypothetical protein V495_07188 [Pseudogymnoascus sp. VKM F-4514 (FW-929)]KFY52061.1 hypothetical protein V497_08672 [Pseudogymnoascus sp. VKM F-4516 (FW-969)]
MRRANGEGRNETGVPSTRGMWVKQGTEEHGTEGNSEHITDQDEDDGHCCCMRRYSHHMFSPPVCSHRRLFSLPPLPPQASSHHRLFSPPAHNYIYAPTMGCYDLARLRECPYIPSYEGRDVFCQIEHLSMRPRVFRDKTSDMVLYAMLLPVSLHLLPLRRRPGHITTHLGYGRAGKGRAPTVTAAPRITGVAPLLSDLRHVEEIRRAQELEEAAAEHKETSSSLRAELTTKDDRIQALKAAAAESDEVIDPDRGSQNDGQLTAIKM